MEREEGRRDVDGEDRRREGRRVGVAGRRGIICV
jgi:hypothetical protein